MNGESVSIYEKLWLALGAGAFSVLLFILRRLWPNPSRERAQFIRNMAQEIARQQAIIELYARKITRLEAENDRERQLRRDGQDALNQLNTINANLRLQLDMANAKLERLR